MTTMNVPPARFGSKNVRRLATRLSSARKVFDTGGYERDGSATPDDDGSRDDDNRVPSAASMHGIRPYASASSTVSVDHCPSARPNGSDGNTGRISAT